MINNQKEKIAAAIAGVIAYIRQNEDAMASCAAIDDVKPDQKNFGLNLWGAGGRADMMNMRLMMQLKALR
ncbi:MAG: hypothetical protein JRJ44_06550 [Deltaproteobacteria bacterium]|nr:hypothetical protein [Deltaproteobacteria bacterium]